MAEKNGTTATYGYNNYTLVRGLGTGAGSKTELVACENTGMLAVRKTLARELANPEAWEALAGVAHPLVPRVRELGWWGSEYCAVYDFVPGESLPELVGRCGTLGEAFAAKLLCDVALAASALHAAGIVHRDISPGNVIVDAEGRAHLTDLGIARVVNGKATHDTTRLGTWGFAAPEQYGFAQTDARSDVFSMGRLLAFACTGTMPEVVSETLDVGPQGFGALSPQMAGIIAKACAFEPSARFQSAEEFRRALAGLAVYVPPVPQKPEAIEADNGRGPLPLRILGWIMVPILAFCAVGVLGGAIQCLIVPGAAESPLGSFLVGVAAAALCADWAFQTLWALLRRGVYAAREGRGKRLFFACLRGTGWFVAAIFAVLAIVAIVGQK